MSKTLKRILSAALVLCMILAVLPATAPVAKAAEYTPAADMKQYVYNFVPTSAVSDPKTYTADNFKNYTDIDDQTQNWYYLNSTHETYVKFNGNSGITFNVGYPHFWYALVLDVPEDGYYQANLQSVGLEKMITNFWVMPKNETTSAAPYDERETASVIHGVADYSKITWGAGFTSSFMLGGAQLNAGQYILLVHALQRIDTKSYSTVTKLTLTKSSNKADALNMALYNAYTDPYRQTSNHKGCLILAADYNAGADDVVFTKPESAEYVALDLAGFTLTAGSVNAEADGAHIVDSGKYDDGSKGAIVAAQKPILRAGNGKASVLLTGTSYAFYGAHKGYYMVETAANTYKFYQPTVKAVTEAYNKYTDGDTTATTYTQGEDVACFAFNAKLPEEVLAAAKANPADVKVTMSWYVNKGKTTVTTFTEESVANWLNDNGASKAFYVNLKGLSKAEEGTIITCTPKITIDQVAYTFADIVLTTAAAA